MVVSTHPKNIRQIASFPQISGWKFQKSLKPPPRNYPVNEAIRLTSLGCIKTIFWKITSFNSCIFCDKLGQNGIETWNCDKIPIKGAQDFFFHQQSWPFVVKKKLTKYHAKATKQNLLWHKILVYDVTGISGGPFKHSPLGFQSIRTIGALHLPSRSLDGFWNNAIKSLEMNKNRRSQLDIQKTVAIIFKEIGRKTECQKSWHKCFTAGNLKKFPP